MKLRERQTDEQRQPDPSDSAPGGDDLSAVSAEAERLLVAGADAIDRALSSDSQAFLRANRQHGGQ